MYMQVMMFSESVTEQSENVFQPTIHLQNECFIEDYFTSSNHNEKKNADNEFPVMCGDDDNIGGDDNNNEFLVMCCNDDNIVDVDEDNAGITIYVHNQQNTNDLIMYMQMNWL